VAAIPAATAEAATTTKTVKTGKTAHYDPRVGCTGTKRANLTTDPAHNLNSGHYFFTVSGAHGLCFGDVIAQIQWNKSFNKKVDASAVWRESSANASSWAQSFNVNHTIGAWSVTWGIHKGFTPISIGEVCVTSEFAAGHAICRGVKTSCGCIITHPPRAPMAVDAGTSEGTEPRNRQTHHS
jgi:hypothetical protein